MKLSTRDAAAFLKAPKSGTALILLYGPDAMRTAITRQDFLKSHLGATADSEMRLTRMTGAELKSEPARLQDATKAMGFFPGARGVFIEDGTDNLAPIVSDALATWEDGDALIVVTAGNLTKGNKLRKLAENAPNAASIALYPEPPNRANVEDVLKGAGVAAMDKDAGDALFALATSLDPGDFRQLAEKIALYTLKQGNPVSLADVMACAPASTEEHLDTIIHAAAEGRVEQIGPQLARLASQGVNPTTLCISTTRHFRQLHLAASAPGGADQGLSRLRPPVFGPRRDILSRQIRGWGMHRLERALSVLMDTDLSLRSSTNHPPMAVMERALIRLAMMSPMRS